MPKKNIISFSLAGAGLGVIGSDLLGLFILFALELQKNDSDRSLPLGAWLGTLGGLTLLGSVLGGFFGVLVGTMAGANNDNKRSIQDEENGARVREGFFTNIFRISKSTDENSNLTPRVFS